MRPSRKLALLGGAPAFSEKLHVGRPNVGDRERFLGRINDMLDRRWFSNNGPIVAEFEARLARLVGVKHCIAVCNATVALEIAIRALGLSGEVIVPSFTFVATAHSLRWQGITPVFCDIDPETHNIDPQRAESLITEKTTGIIGVHIWGRPCAIESLEALARNRGVRLMFDAAHAFGCTHTGKMIGNFGDAEVFSFHATKFLGSGEGGAIATNSDELAAKIRLMKNFGFAGLDKVIYIGTNGKMSELNAAMGLTNLESVDDFIDANRRHYQTYREAFSATPGFKTITFQPEERHNYQYVIVEVDPEESALTRDELIAVLHSENILARRYFYPGSHRMEPYLSEAQGRNDHLPETEALCSRVLALPTGSAITTDDVQRVCGVIHDALGNAAAVRHALQTA